jgi:hypothetical protein
VHVDPEALFIGFKSASSVPQSSKAENFKSRNQLMIDKDPQLISLLQCMRYNQVMNEEREKKRRIDVEVGFVRKRWWRLVV